MIAKPCSRVNLLGWTLGLLLGVAGVAHAGTYRIQPVSDPSQMRLLPASSWPIEESSPTAMVLKLSYLRGLMDALQYVQLAPDTPHTALNALKGMSLKDLARRLEQYYLSHPHQRHLPPAAVVLRILPQQLMRTQPPRPNQGLVPGTTMGYKNSPQPQPE